MYVSFILGLIALIIGIRINNKRRRLIKNGTRVKGIIISLVEQEINDRIIYLPVVRLASENRDVTMSYGTNIPPKTGSTIELLYNSTNPDDVIEYSASMSTPSLILIIIGSVILFIGVIIGIFKVVWSSL